MSARRSSSSRDDPTRISGVPRIGDKLFVAEGLSGGRRVAAGCYKLGTVDDLPARKRDMYNYQRRSKVLFKTL